MRPRHSFTGGGKVVVATIWSGMRSPAQITSVVAQLKDGPGATSRAHALAAKVLSLLESEAKAANEVAADAALYG